MNFFYVSFKRIANEYTHEEIKEKHKDTSTSRQRETKKDNLFMTTMKKYGQEKLRVFQNDILKKYFVNGESTMFIFCSQFFVQFIKLFYLRLLMKFKRRIQPTICTLEWKFNRNLLNVMLEKNVSFDFVPILLFVYPNTFSLDHTHAVFVCLGRNSNL